MPYYYYPSMSYGYHHTFFLIDLVGRIIFGLYFVYAGYNHFKNAAALIGYSTAKKVPSPKAAVYVSGALLVLGGLGVIFHVAWDLSLLFLLIFLIPTTILIHDYWKTTDPAARMSDRTSFLKNVALIAAILAMF